MAEMIAIVGPPGRGKSTSIFPNEELKITGLELDKTVIINVSNKSLSMRGWQKHFDPKKKISEGGNYIITHDAKTVVAVIDVVEKSRPDIENIVVEDAQYLMGFAAMEKAREKGYDKWNEIGDIGFKPIARAKDAVRDNLYIFFLYHEEKGDNGEMKIKTAGRLVDNVITLEGLFSTILFAQMERIEMAKKSNYFFITNADGTCAARSKYGMFPETRIPNDLGLVKQRIKQYNQGE